MMLEAGFQTQIKKLTWRMGWKHYHTYDSRRSEKGYPDSTIIKGDRLIFAELKSAKGRLSNHQREWINALINIQGVECYIWKPTDWQNIVRVLNGDRNNKTRIVSPIPPPKKRTRRK